MAFNLESSLHSTSNTIWAWNAHKLNHTISNLPAWIFYFINTVKFTGVSPYFHCLQNDIVRQTISTWSQFFWFHWSHNISVLASIRTLLNIDTDCLTFYQTPPRLPSCELFPLQFSKVYDNQSFRQSKDKSSFSEK